MSDREAFEKWAEDKTFVIETAEGRISIKGMAWEIWQAASGDCYGDGNVYRGERSEDSSAHTISIETTMIVVNEGRFDNE